MTEAARPRFVFASRWADLSETLDWNANDPNVKNFVMAANTRDVELENWLERLAVPVPPFALPGPVVVSESPPWTPPAPVGVENVRVLLGTAGSATTTVACKVNGTAFETVNMTSTVDDSGVVATGAPIGPGDLLTVAVTTAGAAAEDLTVVFW